MLMNDVILACKASLSLKDGDSVQRANSDDVGKTASKSRQHDIKMHIFTCIKWIIIKYTKPYVLHDMRANRGRKKGWNRSGKLSVDERDKDPVFARSGTRGNINRDTCSNVSRITRYNYSFELRWAVRPSQNMIMCFRQVRSFVKVAPWCMYYRDSIVTSLNKHISARYVFCYS